MGMLTGKEILLLDLYSFQRWPDVRAAFDRFGSYTPSWSAARRQAVADDGDTLEACRVENMRCVAAEMDPDYVRLIARRMARPTNPVLF